MSGRGICDDSHLPQAWLATTDAPTGWAALEGSLVGQIWEVGRDAPASGTQIAIGHEKRYCRIVEYRIIPLKRCYMSLYDLDSCIKSFNHQAMDWS